MCKQATQQGVAVGRAARRAAGRPGAGRGRRNLQPGNLEPATLLFLEGAYDE